MTINNALAGIAVKDVKVAVAWYKRLLGRAPDSRPMEQVAEWRFPSGGWVQVFQSPGQAGSSSVTLSVSDIGLQIQELGSKGIAVGGLMNSTMVRIASIHDPDGNEIVFAEARNTTLAQ
jgi:predicted enzyme related to lactoylglutathione lyase